MATTSKASRQQNIILNMIGVDAATLKPEDRECSICKQSLRPIYSFNNATCPEPTVRLVVCGHTFGVRCIYRWLAQHDHCPMCREALRPLVLPSQREVLVQATPNVDVDQAEAGMTELSVSGNDQYGNETRATRPRTGGQAANGAGGGPSTRRARG